MADVYSLTERLIIYCFLILAAIIFSFLLVRNFIKLKENPWYISLVFILYLAAFIYLNYISIFDLFFSDQKGFEKVREYIITYYRIFYWIDKVLGFIIFNIWIGYLESGYYNIIKKLLDCVIRFFKDICKMKTSENY